MAHPVPDEGDTVEVQTTDGPEEGTVLEARGSFARVEVDGEEIDAHHESSADETRTSYRLVNEEESVDETTEESDPDADNYGGEGDQAPGEVDEDEEAESEAESAETLATIPEDEELEDMEYQALQALAKEVDGVRANQSATVLIDALGQERDDRDSDDSDDE